MQTNRYDTISSVMRMYEQLYDHVPQDSAWIVVRLDGRGFSSFTEKHYEKPFDERFHTTMVQTTKYLMDNFGVIYAYVASDEISLLPPQWEMFDRRVVKLTTLASATASAWFTALSTFIATFDARALAFESFEMVLQYFDWRMADNERNALQTCTYWTLRKIGSAKKAHKALEKADVPTKIQLLEDHGITYADLPTWQRRGTHLYWETYEKKGFNPIKQQEEVAQRRRVAHREDFSVEEAFQAWLTKYCHEV